MSVAAAPPPFNTHQQSMDWPGRDALLSRTILISGLSKDATESSLKMLFGSLGRIESLLYSPAGDSPLLPIGHASIVFSTPEEATWALRLNGCVGWGAQIDIKLAAATVNGGGVYAAAAARVPPMIDGARRASPFSVPREKTGADMGQAPSHKNLYVLNLPLDATTDQLAALFSGYGTVVHCVILAMLDAQARRRGFIDMNAPAEAKAAIESLNGFVWKGYPIEVSYAIVQRSGGPFDHTTGRNLPKRNVPRNRFNTGPRRITQEQGSPGYFEASLHGSQAFGIAASGFISPTRSDNESFGGSEVSSLAYDLCTLFVSGLDPVAILDDEDFKRVLEPYGRVTAVSLSRDERGISRGFGIVTFATEGEAARARENLDNKMVNGRRITARNLDPAQQCAVGRNSAGHTQSYTPPPGTGGMNAPASAMSYFSHGHQSLPYDDRQFGPGRRLDHVSMNAIAPLRPDLSRMRSAATSITDAFGRGQLGEPFEQKTATDGQARFIRHDGQTPDPTQQQQRSAKPANALQTPSPNDDWRHRHAASVSVDAYSPASTFSMSTLSSTSELHTPESVTTHGNSHNYNNSVLIHNPDQIWTFPHASIAGHGSPLWARGEKDIAVESALSQLRRDSPPLQAHDRSSVHRAVLAPVGHEKTNFSSPARRVSGHGFTMSAAAVATDEANTLSLSNLKLGD